MCVDELRGAVLWERFEVTQGSLDHYVVEIKSIERDPRFNPEEFKIPPDARDDSGLPLTLKLLDSLPVYRHQDQGEDVTKNQETFAAAAKWLAKGGTIGICPEGISHDEPGLQPIKTGTARIALGAVASIFGMQRP